MRFLLNALYPPSLDRDLEKWQGIGLFTLRAQSRERDRETERAWLQACLPGNGDYEDRINVIHAQVKKKKMKIKLLEHSELKNYIGISLVTEIGIFDTNTRTL